MNTTIYLIYRINQIIIVSVKFQKLKAFYNKAQIDKTIEQYKSISLKYHNQVVCAK